MKSFAETCDKVGKTTKKLEKIAIVADYFNCCAPPDAPIAAVFFSGRPFPVFEETTLQVGGTLLWRVVSEISGGDEAATSTAYRRHGDVGAAAEEILPAISSSRTLTLRDVESLFRSLAAARGPAAKRQILFELLSHVTPLEAKYLIKIVTGELRIGLKESLVEDAIAKAYGTTLKEVQHANMLLGDIGETLKLARDGRLAEARMRMFHPLGFMLASPTETAEEALSYFDPALVEHKYDGIRAQAHCSRGEVRIFSRTRDDITESFPELPDALAGLPEDVILDGEILAWSYPAGAAEGKGRALPFRVLQERLGRKRVSQELMQRVPVAYLAFDVLYAKGKLQIRQSLRDRAKLLDEIFAAPLAEKRAVPLRSQGRLGFPSGEDAIARLMRAPVFQAASPEELDRLFDEAQAEGNEGLMIKDPASQYTPGRRGKSWLKLKRELATLDVVVTAVEFGHGRRAKVLSDYTFAVRDGDRLVNIGKAYSGLTDVEIAEMTGWFLAHTLEGQGYRRTVEPKIVIEVAFNNMMESDRHESGYALRFPRIVRLRPDKLPEDADTIARAKEIYEGQRN